MISNNGSFAQGFAAHAHRKQLYGASPYMVHVGEVVAIIKASGHGRDKVLDAAWLHDVLEDTDTTRHEIGAVFDPFVVDWVWAVTGTGNTRKERNQSIYHKCKDYAEPTLIKLADRLANVRHATEHRQHSFLKMYKKESIEFTNALRNDSMVLLRPLWDELEAITRLGEEP